MAETRGPCTGDYLSSQCLVCKRRATQHVDLISGRLVRVRDGLVPVGRGHLVDIHRLLQARTAHGNGAPRKAVVEGQMVEVGLGRVGLVGHGVAKTVRVGIRVLEARRAVHDRVRDQTQEGLGGGRHTRRIVGTAVGRLGQVLGYVGQVAGAAGGVGRAGVVKDRGDADEGLFSVEEGL